MWKWAMVEERGVFLYEDKLNVKDQNSWSESECFIPLQSSISVLASFIWKEE